MPFQDVDEIETIERRSPSGAEKLLRKLFIDDWSLKLLSLGITLALWFVVTGQNTPVNTHAQVQLKFIRPNGLEISNDPPKSVEVLLNGSKHKLESLDPRSLVATVDISDERPGERVLRLAGRAQLDLPEGVKIEAYQPSTILVHLEPVIDRQLSIEAKTEGKPADGFELYGVRPSKNVVNIHGPASLVNAVQNATTESISLAGRKESFTAANVAVDISDPKVDLLDPVVNVEVEIGERRVERSFSDVPVNGAATDRIRPRTALVTVLGPASVISGLHADDIKIRLDSINNSLQPQLELPPQLQGKVTLKAINPSKFTLK